MDGVDVGFGLGGVEEQLVVVATTLAAGAFYAKGQAVVAAQLHAGGVPVQVAGVLWRGAAAIGAGSQGQGEGQQGKGFGVGHDVEVR
ncbi:hypothetical protein D3C73_1103480 [compost metagenome]